MGGEGGYPIKLSCWVGRARETGWKETHEPARRIPMANVTGARN